jgi:peroxiredoxin Q/BCP
MTSSKTDRRQRPAGTGKQAQRRAAQRTRRIRRTALVAVAVLAVLGGLYAVYATATRSPSTGGGAAGGSGYPFQVGQPGPGAPAPGFSLAATTGGRVDLDSLRGKTVLLYFQEGLSCQPCWDQLTDLEKNSEAVTAAGIDQVVSITTDPVDLIARKTADMGIHTTVLSDPDLAVSKAYDANAYGMMGEDRDGHTFILIRPDGTIGWRADYGGAPKYTMFLPTSAILADLHAATTSGATP